MTEGPHDPSQVAQAVPYTSEELLKLVYRDLRNLAAAKLSRQKPGQTLQATALVHEAYLRLVKGAQSCAWQNRGHFFAAAAEAMRRILVDQARRKQALKRGGQLQRQPLIEDRIEAPQTKVDILALNDALDQLAQSHPRNAELVKLRYFAGLTIAEAAEALGVSDTTVEADWAYAKSWLRVQMGR